MKLKFISDGTPRGSRVVDAETGAELPGVTEVMLHINSKHMTMVVVTFERMEIEIECEPDNFLLASEIEGRVEHAFTKTFKDRR